MKTVCAFDIQKNSLPREFDELAEIAEKNLPVVYWWDKHNVKHAKIMQSIDAADAAVSRAFYKNIPAFCVGTIKEGRMVMSASFYGPLRRYSGSDRYWLGTHGIELHLAHKRVEMEKREHDAQMHMLREKLANQLNKQKQQELKQDKQVPKWATAIQKRFPDVRINVQTDNVVFVIEPDGYETRTAFVDNQYVCTYFFKDETYPKEIDGFLEDKWVEEYKFTSIDELESGSFSESVQNLDCEYFAC